MDDEGADPRARPVVYTVSPDESGSGTRRRAGVLGAPAAIALWVAVAVVLVGGAWAVVNAINPVGPTGRAPELWLPDPTPVHTDADATRSLTPAPRPSATPTHGREDRPSVSPSRGRGGDDRRPGRHDDHGGSESHDDHGGSSGGSDDG